MKKILVIAVVVLFLQGCTSKVEIPIRHAGVVKTDEQVSAEVLKSGTHSVSFGSQVIVYDISLADLDFECGFLFSDAFEGNFKVAIEFNPIADSLSSFYRKYQSEYVIPVVEQATCRVTRDLLFKYKSTDLTKEEFQIEILKAIKANHAIVNYVEIKKVDIIELKILN